MAFQVSPGVNISEFDLTTIIPAPAGPTGSIVGELPWGPIETLQPITNELELVERFGSPTGNLSANAYSSFFTAANYLSYASSAIVVRAKGNGAYNATANAAAYTGVEPSATVMVKNSDEYSNDYITFYTSAANTPFIARYAGDLGNGLKVSFLANTSSSAFDGWAYKALFDRKPGTSYYVAQNYSANSNDEIYIVVVDGNGAISGRANSVIEKFVASKATNAKDENNNSLYYRDVLLAKSRWVYWGGHFDSANTGTTSGDNLAWGSAATSSGVFKDTVDVGGVTLSFKNGALGTIEKANIVACLDLLADPSVDVNFICTGPYYNAAQEAIQVAEDRKDCLAFISPPLSTVLGNSKATDVANSRVSYTSSYGVMDSGWKYQYDKYNDTYRYIPLNGDIAGLCARTDATNDPWFSPAGQVRGQIRNIVRLAWNPSQAERDVLYKADVNPVVTFRGEGTYLFGDKTLLGRPSAFDRINVRRLFITLEKTIARAARASLFEFNDEFTRSQFVALVDPYLRSVQAGRGIYDYLVVCDERNNTPQIIDQNQFVGDIYIKPARSINFIQLNFVALRTGVSFEEIIGNI